MSYCRWGEAIPESAPNVDLSTETWLNYAFSKDKKWSDYLKENNVDRSEAYVYEYVYGGYICHWTICSRTAHFDTATEMADYLTMCKKEGALVAQHVIDELNEEGKPNNE